MILFLSHCHIIFKSVQMKSQNWWKVPDLNFLSAIRLCFTARASIFNSISSTSDPSPLTGNDRAITENGSKLIDFLLSQPQKNWGFFFDVSNILILLNYSNCILVLFVPAWNIALTSGVPHLILLFLIGLNQRPSA